MKLQALPGGAWVACRPCTSLGFSSPPKNTLLFENCWSATWCQGCVCVCVSWGGPHHLPLWCRERLQHPLWPWLGTESGWRCAGAEYIPLYPPTFHHFSLKLRTNNVSHWMFSGRNSIQKSRLGSCYHLDCLWIPEPGPREAASPREPWAGLGGGEQAHQAHQWDATPKLKVSANTGP